MVIGNSHARFNSVDCFGYVTQRGSENLSVASVTHAITTMQQSKATVQRAVLPCGLGNVSPLHHQHSRSKTGPLVMSYHLQNTAELVTVRK